MQKSEHRFFLSSGLSVIFSILFVYIVCSLMKTQVSTDFYVDINNLFTVDSSVFLPEPLERLRFITAVFCIPIFMIFIYVILDKFLMKFKDDKLRLPALFLRIVIIGLIIFLMITYSRMSELDFFIENNYLLLNPWLSSAVLIIFGAIIFFLLKIKVGNTILRTIKKRSTIINRLLSLLIVCYIIFIAISSIYSLYSFDDSGIFSSHFNATFHSMAMVHLGDNLLIDLVNQYGLYPQFLEIIFSVIGLSVLKFTTLMGILVFINFFLLYRSLNKLIDNIFFVLVGFLMILYYGYMHFKLVNSDPYFQYFPIRTLFPALLIYLSVNYFLKRSRLKYFLYTMIFSIAVLWNLDTGLIVFIAWMLVLIYDEMLSFRRLSDFIKRSSIHILFMLISLLGVILIYLSLIFLRSGHFPDLLDFVKYQVYFYGYGFFMLPMKFIHPWNMIALIYILGLVFSLKSIIIKDNSLTARIIFLVTILGVGLLSYYQGRSHDHVLSLVWYPAFFLLALFTYKSYQQVKCEFLSHRKNWLNVLVFIFLMVFSLSSILNLSVNSKTFFSLINERASKYLEKKETPVTSGIEFIRNNTIKGEKSLILSYHSAIYYLNSQTNPGLDIPGMSEIFLKSDYEKIFNSIKATSFKKVFIDLNFITNIQLNYATNLKVLDELIRQGYYVADQNKFNNILMLERKESENTTVLKGEIPQGENSYLHYYQYGGLFSYDLINNKTIGNKENLPPINLKQKFSIELMIKPEDTQVQYAAVMGNHPGDGHQGFIIQQDNENRNVYNFIYGDGSEWSQPLAFALIPNKASYLSLTNNNGDIRIYIDGKLENSIVSNLNKFENSKLPLSIGNWINMDRSFNGEISEIEIINEVLTPDNISENWELMNRK